MWEKKTGNVNISQTTADREVRKKKLFKACQKLPKSLGDIKYCAINISGFCSDFKVFKTLNSKKSRECDYFPSYGS